ncbi:MAG: hypothetical protein IJC83_04995 [Oscillospiraceae bacterium]|nr:hypothetical protein [Oscillospiraceae bacterium]
MFIKNNIKALFIHIFIAVLSAVAVVLIMKNQVVLFAKYPMPIIIGALYVLGILLYIFLGRLFLKPTKNKFTDIFCGLLIFLVGFFIWIVTVGKTNRPMNAVILPEYAGIWGAYNLYNVVMIPFLRYVKIPTILLFTNLIPSVFLFIGLQFRRKHIKKYGEKPPKPSTHRIARP